MTQLQRPIRKPHLYDTPPRPSKKTTELTIEKSFSSLISSSRTVLYIIQSMLELFGHIDVVELKPRGIFTESYRQRFFWVNTGVSVEVVDPDDWNKNDNDNRIDPRVKTITSTDEEGKDVLTETCWSESLFGPNDPPISKTKLGSVVSFCRQVLTSTETD